MDKSFVARKRGTIAAAALCVALGGSVFVPRIEFAYAQTRQVQQVVPAVRPESFADIVERVKPAVVSVQARRDPRDARPRGGPDFGPDDPLWRFFREFRERRGFPDDRDTPRPGLSQGSGFFISPDGFLVTNNHVVEGADSFLIVLDDGTRLDARLVGSDPRTDIAVLKVERQQPLPFVRFAQTQPRIGDWVIAIGNPFGLGGTVTAGIVSARGRDIGAGNYDDFLQIDAPVNRGNSGGPTFDVEGSVVGITTAIYSPTGGSVGIGFAIPSTIAEPVIAQLRENGSVVRGWLGVQIQAITDDIARSIGLPTAQGALVADVQPGSPAMRAGIRAGDVVLSLDGTSIRDVRDLTRRVAAIAPHQTARFEILRQGRREAIEVTIGRLPSDMGQAEAPRGGIPRSNGDTERGSSLDSLGVALAASRRGVQVVNVDPQGAAARRGLREGDIILEVAGEAVTRPSDVLSRLRAVRGEGKESVLVRVRSGDQIRFVTLPTG